MQERMIHTIKKYVQSYQKSLLPGITFALGVLFFCFYHQWILVFFPFNVKHSTAEMQTLYSKKRVDIFYWSYDKWHKESTELIWSEASSDTVHHLINSWLAILDEENILNNRVTLQSVSFTQSQKTVLLSFDQSFFNEQSSINKKLMIIEGLLKTIKESGLKLSSVYILVHHKPLPDRHLDFTQAWPIDGFLD